MVKKLALITTNTDFTFYFQVMPVKIKAHKSVAVLHSLASFRSDILHEFALVYPPTFILVRLIVETTPCIIRFECNTNYFFKFDNICIIKELSI